MVGANSSRVGLCELARNVGGARCVDPLQRIASNHPHYSVRVAALRSLATIDPDAGRTLAKAPLSDDHADVRELGRFILDGSSATPAYAVKESLR